MLVGAAPAVISDASNSDYPSVRKCSGYVGATKTVTLDSAPDFTIVGGDGVKAFVTAPGTTAPTVGEIRTEMEGAGTKLTLALEDTDELQTNQGNWVTATGFSVPHEYDAVLAALQADLDNTAQYKADVSALGDIGDKVDLIIGLSQENYYLDQTVYNASHKLLSGRIRTYSVAGSVGTDADVLATYTITSVWSGSELQTYKVVKQ